MSIVNCFLLLFAKNGYLCYNLCILNGIFPQFERRVSTLVEVKKKDNENFDSLLRRFNRKIQQSGVLIRARKTRFFARTKSRNLQKVAARRRTQIKAEKEEQKRMGKPVPARKFGRR